MKKLAKVGVLCLALATLVSVLHVSADTRVTKQVTLTLIEGSSTCVLNDYTFGDLQASPSDQLTEAVTGSITCTFLKNNADVVTLTMSDLSSNIGTSIPASGFNAQISSGVVQGSIGNLVDQTITSLASSQEIYSKDEYTIGEWTGTLTLQGVIPGGTPGGTYTGSLDLTLQYVGVQNTGSSQNSGN